MKTLTINTLSILLGIPALGAVLVAALPLGAHARRLTGLLALVTGGLAVRIAVLCAELGGFGDQAAGGFIGARFVDRLPLPGLRVPLVLEPLTAPLLLVAGLVGAAGILGVVLADKGSHRGTLAGALALQGLLLGTIVVDGLVPLAGAFVLVGLIATFVPLVALHARPAGAAALRAFVLHRLGDFALVVGLFALHTSLQGLTFEALLAGPPALEPWTRVADVGVFGGFAHRTLWFIAASGVIVAAATRSGLLSWPLVRDLTASPDLPGPVAGLVHAALQGSAGILLVRLHPLLSLSPEATDGLIWAAVITTVAAGTLALAGRDLLRLDTHLLAATAGIGGILAALPTTVSMSTLATLVIMPTALTLPWMFSSLVSIVKERDPHALGGLEHVVPRLHTTRLLVTASLALLPPFSGWVLWERALESVVMSTRVPAIVVVLLVVGGLVVGLAGWRVIHLVFAGPRSTRETTAPSLSSTLPALLLAFVVPGLALLELPRTLLASIPLDLDYTGPLLTFVQPSLAETLPVRNIFGVALATPPLSQQAFIGLAILVGIVPWIASLLIWHRRRNGDGAPPGAALLASPPVTKLASLLSRLGGRDSVVARSVADGVDVLSRVLAANLVPATLSVVLQRVPAFCAWLVALLLRGTQSGGAQRTLVIGCAVAAALAWWQTG
ncbi:MAG TPA: proton-conducting transporter membrane subunit [Myxococcota bacterium]